MVAVIEVTGDANEADLPDADIEVSGTDYAFSGPDTLEAGETTIAFTNNGGEAHEMNLLRLAEGAELEQILAAFEAEVAGEAPPDGPPPLEAFGGIQAIGVGDRQLMTVDLEAGTYALVCFVPNAEGIPHVFLGMGRQFRVE